jgi:hypothetical protein
MNEWLISVRNHWLKSFPPMKTPLTVLFSSLMLALPTLAQQAAAHKHAVLIAGKPSHGPGQHEHNAGVLLLKKCLDESGLPIKTTVKLNADWPSKAELASADTVLIYCDGGPTIAAPG